LETPGVGKVAPRTALVEVKNLPTMDADATAGRTATNTAMRTATNADCDQRNPHARATERMTRRPLVAVQNRQQSCLLSAGTPHLGNGDGAMGRCN